MPTFRSSHRRCSIKNGVLKNFTIFTGKHLCWRLRPVTLLKKRRQNICFPVNITIILRTPILKNICEQLFLYFRILRKIFLKNNEKMANRNLGSEKSRKSRKINPSFLISEFSILPTTKIENSDLKILEKNFRDFRGFRVFDLAQFNIA